MDSNTLGELLSRIDERTKTIKERQDEEIRARQALGDRVGVLENWRNYMAGATAILYLFFGLLGYAIKAMAQK